MIQKTDVLNYIKEHDFEVLIVLGAGDLDNQVPQITKLLNSKLENS
jgi:UDP-N-acetylmuramate--alanine ligase